MSLPAAVLTDIEGTTTPVAFVHQRLFPYARERLAGFIAAHGDEAAVREQLAATAAEANLDPSDHDGLVRCLQDWIDQDRKATPLKALQGMIWEAGYREGELQGPMYPDVPVALRRWHQLGIRLAVYSSGSEAAQRLIFGYSDAGDLTGLFQAFFDTRIGHKREADAYRVISQRMGLPPANILFLSDVAEELAAARAAGLEVVLVDRDGQTQATGAFRVIEGFHELDF